MLDLSLPEFFVACGSVLLAILLLTEIFDWTNIFALPETQLPLVSLGTSNARKVLYPENLNKYDISINIEPRGAVVMEHSKPLAWSGYSSKPLLMNMANDGNTVTVTGIWSPETRPSLAGGPLSDIYDFHSILFHWGSIDEMGSEHSINGVNYPLELQLIHVKRGYDSPIDAIVDGTNHGVAIVSIFFEISNVDNHCLDHVVKNLWCTPRPGMKISISSFPLNDLFTTFDNNYYSYSGSPIQENHNEIVTWILQPKPAYVSSSQLNKFRSLYLADVPILMDSIRRLNDRELYYHD